jgi:anti-sigma regulatory factor (Ser/Thr protein kinase)
LPQVKLTIASRLDEVPLLGRLVHALCLHTGLADLEANEVEVCVAEVINNSIKHAYGGDPNHSVVLEVNLLATELTLDIWDSGRSVEPSKIHHDHHQAFTLDPEHPEEFSESGRGLAIIQQMMDSFEYTPGPEWNRFRLIKHLKRSCNPRLLLEKAIPETKSRDKD